MINEKPVAGTYGVLDFENEYGTNKRLTGCYFNDLFQLSGGKVGKKEVLSGDAKGRIYIG